ncbi:hypothetical protein PEC311524_35350 [Pectobacterium carotovorum subsp. carotovorum]|nr:hypothetical protein PEC311524_35350 [Pectobacterium carotovorum subsp. carotovorum]
MVDYLISICRLNALVIYLTRFIYYFYTVAGTLWLLRKREVTFIKKLTFSADYHMYQH